MTSSGEGIEEKREGATPSRFLNRYYARTAAASSTGFSTLDRGGVWLSWPWLAFDGGLSWRSGADLLKMLQNRGDAVDSCRADNARAMGFSTLDRAGLELSGTMVGFRFGTVMAAP